MIGAGHRTIVPDFWNRRRGQNDQTEILSPCWVSDSCRNGRARRGLRSCGAWRFFNPDSRQAFCRSLPAWSCAENPHQAAAFPEIVSARVSNDAVMISSGSGEAPVVLDLSQTVLTAADPAMLRANRLRSGMMTLLLLCLALLCSAALAASAVSMIERNRRIAARKHAAKRAVLRREAVGSRQAASSFRPAASAPCSLTHLYLLRCSRSQPRAA